MNCILVATVVAVVVGVGGGGTAAGQEKPKPLPTALVAAWEKAGAAAGWMRSDKHGSLEFQVGGDGKAAVMPAFRFAPWQAGVLDKLPVPEQAFGLDLVGTEVTDAGLNDLARLKQLRTLDLGDSRMRWPTCPT